nr:AMP-binding protein [Pseudomonas sp. ALS1131]
MSRRANFATDRACADKTPPATARFADRSCVRQTRTASAYRQRTLKIDGPYMVCGTPPLAFTFGLGGLLCFPLRAGASTVLLERLTPADLLATIDRFKVTMTFTAPTFYRQMAALVGRYSLASLRASVSAGEALPDATRQLWKQATGIEMTDGIGGTEMIHVYVSSPPEQVRPGAIGKVVPAQHRHVGATGGRRPRL